MAVDSEPLSASNSLNEAEAACTQITHPAHVQHRQSSFANPERTAIASKEGAVGAGPGNFMIRHACLIASALVVLGPSALVAQEAVPLKTAVDGTFAPHAMPNLSGGYEGFNIDLANEIGKRLKRKVTIDAVQFSGLVPRCKPEPTISWRRRRR